MPTVKVIKTQEVEVDFTLTPEQEQGLISQISYKIIAESYEALACRLGLLFSTRPEYNTDGRGRVPDVEALALVPNTVLNVDRVAFLTDEQKEAIYAASKDVDIHSDIYKYLEALYRKGIAAALRDLANDQDTKAGVLLLELPKENMPSPVSRMW